MSAGRDGKKHLVQSLVGTSESVASTAEKVRSTVALALRHLESEKVVTRELRAAIDALREALRALYAVEVGGIERIHACLETAFDSIEAAHVSASAHLPMTDALQSTIERVAIALASLNSVRDAYSRSQLPR